MSIFFKSRIHSSKRRDDVAVLPDLRRGSTSGDSFSILSISFPHFRRATLYTFCKYLISRLSFFLLFRLTLLFHSLARSNLKDTCIIGFHASANTFLEPLPFFTPHLLLFFCSFISLGKPFLSFFRLLSTHRLSILPPFPSLSFMITFYFAYKNKGL